MLNFGRENTGSLAKWWRNIDKQIFFLFIFLLMLGLFFSFTSTTSVISEKMNKQTYFFFIKHFVFVLISLFLLILISLQDQKKLIKFFNYLFFISILLLVLTLVLGVEIKGSKRWIDLPFLPLRFQPVELVKPLFIVFVSKIIFQDEKINYIEFIRSLSSSVKVKIFKNTGHYISIEKPKLVNDTIFEWIKEIRS